MQCPRCQHENRPQAKFCEECAARWPAPAPQATADTSRYLDGGTNRGVDRTLTPSELALWPLVHGSLLLENFVESIRIEGLRDPATPSVPPIPSTTVRSSVEPDPFSCRRSACMEGTVLAPWSLSIPLCLLCRERNVPSTTSARSFGKSAISATTQATPYPSGSCSLMFSEVS
jgi:hypothetical protein